MIIPKIIHYVWVGNKKMGYLEKKCVESWQLYFNDYQLMLWNEENIPFDNVYIKRAYEHHKWANISNFVRLYALKKFGGLYFDTDFEVIKKFDFIDNLECFIGYESESDFVNNAIMGAIPSHPFVTDCLSFFGEEFDGTEIANLSSPVLATNVLKSYGDFASDTKELNGVKILSREYFSPYDPDKLLLFTDIKENTYGIHHWQGSWVIDELQNENRYLKRFHDKITKGKGSFRFLVNIIFEYFKARAK
jgi:mannosyltransferase OCH1-like enzyme